MRREIEWGRGGVNGKQEEKRGSWREKEKVKKSKVD